jgi:glyoxylase-like metal-dependent hydrolase (beta-lactamase superfamily II)
MLKKSFRIFAIPLFKDNYSYIVQTSSKEPLLLVDPANPAVIINCLEKYFSDQNVGHILYTHKHWDHAGGSEDLYKLLVTKQEKLQVYSGI